MRLGSSLLQCCQKRLKITLRSVKSFIWFNKYNVSDYIPVLLVYFYKCLNFHHMEVNFALIILSGSKHEVNDIYSEGFKSFCLLCFFAVFAKRRS